MIEYKSQNGNTELKAIGSDSDLFADTMILIKRIYTHLKMVDDELAEKYKDNIIFALVDPNSPLYKEDRK